MQRTCHIAFTIAVFFSSMCMFAATQKKLLTNADVIALIEAGLSEGIVLEKIRASAVQFDTSTEALLSLKKAGVPDRVIRLMVNPDAKADVPTSAAAPWQPVADTKPAPCQAPASGPIPWLAGSSPAMWSVEATSKERTEMMYERGTMHDVGFMGIGAVLLVLHPIRAQLRLSRNPVFHSCINATDTPLVKFELDREADERNTSVGRMTPFKRSYRISEKDLVPISFTKTPQGYFEITPRSELLPGEYGFVPQASIGYFNAGERVYTFGVD